MESSFSIFRFRRLLLWTAGGLTGAVLGCAVLIEQSIERQRDEFETGARIAHRLLSQRAVQHEAVLTTLSLMQPVPDVRLPAVYPQFLHVWRRAAGEAWPGSAALQQALAAAERLPGGPKLALADLPAGGFWIVAPAREQAAAYALEISLPLMVPWAEWPFGSAPQAAQGIRAWLEHGGARWAIHAGVAEQDAAGELRRFSFRKHLAADSQPFDLVVERSYRLADLPWLGVTLWIAAWTAVLAVLAHVLRQRRARKRAEELLRLGQVSRLNALGELAAGLAHELNQPLTAVLAGTQAAARLLTDDPPELEAARNAMTAAATQARRAADVVARLRRVIERPNAGRRIAVDLAGAVRDVLHLLEPECRKRGVTVQMAGDQAAPAQADPVALEQIVHNLIGNALHALEGVAAPALTLTVERDADAMARLIVRDNGPGVAPELVERLFEPFVSGRPGGLGLGLSLCRTLAEEMGGHLHYRAATPGAQFILELPAAQSAGEPQQRRVA